LYYAHVIAGSAASGWYDIDEAHGGVSVVAIRGISKHQEGPPRGLTAASIAPHWAEPLSWDAHILCCVELTQNFFAQLVGPRWTAATSFSADAGEFAGGAFDGRLDFSVTGDRGSLTISPALTLRMI